MRLKTLVPAWLRRFRHSVPILLRRSPFVRYPAGAWVVATATKRLAIDFRLFRTAADGLCRDSEGQPIPWLTFPAIEYLRQLDLSAKRVFEYGTGLSTIFWARRAASVVAVEADPKWADFIRPQLPPNAELILSTREDEYAAAIARSPAGFDVIIVDGWWRLSCVRAALARLNPGGIVVLDNSDWHPKCAELLRSQGGLIGVDFVGFGPQLSRAWATSIFFRRDFNIPFSVSRSGAVRGGYRQDFDA